MGLLRALGSSALIVAIGLGTIGKLRPELFLSLPGPAGFLLWHFVGGRHLPPYFDNTPFLGDSFRDWIRDGDVVVATGAKTGTTWLCYCADAIRRKGSDEVGLPYTDIMMTTPWMELSHKPGETWAMRRELYNKTVLADGSRLKDFWDNAAFPFRVFKSHFLPRGTGDPFQSVLPVKEAPKVKFISAVRKPDEYIRSIFSFFPNHHPDFVAMWGGFPPAYDSLDAVVKDHLPGNPLVGLYIEYTKAWWEFRHEPNVLLLHYTDNVKDIDGMVTKLADFLGVKLSRSEFATVKEKCSYQHMNAQATAFDYKLLFAAETGAGTPTIMQSGKFTAQSKYTQKKPELSLEGKTMWNDGLEKELEPALLSWLREAGPLPQ